VTAEPARVISIRNPWAWRIVAGLQVVVVRPWKPSWRGVLWVHASEDSDLSAPARLWPSRSQPINSAIIGHVTLAGVEGRPGAWRWVLTNPRQLAEPVTGVHGHPGLWLMDLPPRLTAGGNGPRFLPGTKGGYGWRYCTRFGRYLGDGTKLGLAGAVAPDMGGIHPDEMRRHPVNPRLQPGIDKRRALGLGI
jgi:hypothetical protein